MSVQLLAAVQSQLQDGVVLVSALSGSLLSGTVPNPRSLALIRRDANHALLVLFPEPTAVETALPIDISFTCQFDPDSRHQGSVDVYVKVKQKDLSLLLELPPGQQTGNFVAELFRCMEESGRDGSDFSWLERPADQAPVSMATPGRGPVAARELFIRHQMALQRHQYTHTEALSFFVGTWNVNGQPNNGSSLSEWLACDPDPPDLYAIGFQELDLSKEAFLFSDSPREAEWQEAVLNSLHPGARYHKVELVRLVGMMLLVLVQEKHMAYVRNSTSDTVGTGLMGKMGNKGGVSVRLELHSTSLCFVCSHFAAHTEEYLRRNQDFHDICARTRFPRLNPPRHIKDHDQVYWLGDLNYRVTGMELAMVKGLLEAGDLKSVLQADQLGQQMAVRNIFVGFREGAVKFAPTYKFDPGTDNWDSSEKARAPAWCDRVLWRGEEVRLLSYRSHPRLRLSDHKPVSAVFEASVRKVDTVRQRQVHEEVMKRLDKLENEFLPQVMVDSTEVQFGTVRYQEPRVRELTVANTGQVPVSFEFICKLDDCRFCKPWLSVEPHAGFILPGEKCDITLEVLVEKRSAYRLNAGQDKLYDILVLHLEGGKDIFITVNGTYERSCFGCSMEALARMSVPIRELTDARVAELEVGGASDPAHEAYPVPKEVWHLVDHLYRHGLREPGLFVTPGLNSELSAIRVWLDCGPSGGESVPGGAHSAAEALLMLLESAPEPLVPFSMQAACLAASSSYLQCKQLAQQLPDQRRNVFLYLCSFLQEVLAHADANGLDAKTVASLFGSVFLREPARAPSETGARPGATAAQDRKRMGFVHHFLVNDPSDLLPRW